MVEPFTWNIYDKSILPRPPANRIVFLIRSECVFLVKKKYFLHSEFLSAKLDCCLRNCVLLVLRVKSQRLHFSRMLYLKLTKELGENQRVKKKETKS